MCSGAILLYGIPRVVIGENGTFVGEEDLLRSRGVQVVVMGDARCQKLMRDFIKEHPKVRTLIDGQPLGILLMLWACGTSHLSEVVV